METITLSPEQAKTQAEKICDDVKTLTEGLNNGLILAYKKEVKQLTLFCFKDPHDNNGNWYSIQIKGKYLEKPVGLHGFSKEIIKETISNFRKAGWVIKQEGKFSTFGGGSFKIDLP
jgi:hypothetical protein